MIKIHSENMMTKNIQNIARKVSVLLVVFLISPGDTLAYISLDCIILGTYIHPVIDYCTSADLLLAH